MQTKAGLAETITCSSRRSQVLPPSVPGQLHAPQPQGREGGKPAANSACQTVEKRAGSGFPLLRQPARQPPLSGTPQPLAARACRRQPPRLASAPAARARAPAVQGRPTPPNPPGKNAPTRASRTRARAPGSATSPGCGFHAAPSRPPPAPRESRGAGPARARRETAVADWIPAPLPEAGCDIRPNRCNRRTGPSAGASPTMGVSGSGWLSSGGYPATTALHPSLPGQSRKPDATGVTDWCPSQSSPGPWLKPLPLGLCF